jgi:hypothetical protein
MSAKWNAAPKHSGAHSQPVWDYQKVLGQWAEERDVTRELLAQHTAWIDTIKRELVKRG